MAENFNALVASRVTVRILDFGANSYTAGAVEPESIMPILANARVKGRVMKNSSAGRALYATIDGGTADEGSDIQPMFVMADPNNTTDTTLKELLLGLFEGNLTSKTGYSTWNVVSPLTGGGNQEAILELTIYDNEGGANIASQNFMVKELPAMSNQGGHFAIQPTLNLTSSVTWS